RSKPHPLYGRLIPPHANGAPTTLSSWPASANARYRHGYPASSGPSGRYSDRPRLFRARLVHYPAHTARPCAAPNWSPPDWPAPNTQSRTQAAGQSPQRECPTKQNIGTSAEPRPLKCDSQREAQTYTLVSLTVRQIKVERPGRCAHNRAQTVTPGQIHITKTGCSITHIHKGAHAIHTGKKV